MCYYVVHVIIEKSRAEEWLHWMQQEHLPEVMATGAFSAYLIFRKYLLPNEASSDNCHYVIQYHCLSRQHLDRYLTEHAPSLRRKHEEKFRGAFQATRELWQAIEKSQQCESS
ncbi:MAG: DUF4286 family protein [Chitinophagales bacterium]|nr:DUF4286 family protein [Chitinophagales bacterium]MDW8428046.1 DUF4286 family protein [Chitinophagales bacterium]